MRFYVAGAWVEQHQRARPMIRRLEEAGLTCTCNWTQAEGDVCACGHHRQEHEPFTERGASTLEVADAPLACAHRSDLHGGFDCACQNFNGIGAGGDAALTDEARRKYALADLQGVLDADVVWLLAANDKGACGSWVELGAALAARQVRKTGGVWQEGPAIVVSGPKNKRTIFTELADRLFESDEEALRYVVSLK